MERNRLFNRESEYSREEEKLDWKSARLATDEYMRESGHGIYATTLGLRDNPDMTFFSFVRFHNDGMPYVEIPLSSPKGIKKDLVEEFYTSATFMGEVDDEKFEDVATSQNKLDGIMTYLNQTVAGVSSDQTFRWFYDVFRVDHLDRRGEVYFSCHSAADSFNATIELDNHRWSDDLEDLDAFVRKISVTYPHLKFEPLSKDDYLKAIETTLPFLPKDWDV